MKNLLYIVLLGSLLLLFSSCDDKLEIEPANKYSENTVIRDKASAEASLNGIRGKFNRVFLTQPLIGIHDCARAGYMYDRYSTHIPLLDNTASRMDRRLWYYHYEVIAHANAFLEGISGITNIDEDVKQSLIAEGKFLRGFAFWRLLKYQGFYWDVNSTEGILIKTATPDLKDEDWPRSSVKESYAYILSDMEDVDLIPEFRHARFMNRTTAKIIKAQVFLNRGIEGDYQKAYDIVNEVLPDGDVASMAHLVEKDYYAQMFLDLWDNPEALYTSYTEISARRPFSMIDYYTKIVVYCFLAEPIKGLWPECLDEEGELVDLSTMADVRMAASMSRTSYYGSDQYGRGRFAYTKGIDHNASLKLFCTPYLRWGEIYLMKAELMSRLGMGLDKAMVPLNKIRERAGATVLPTPASLDDFNLTLYEEYARELAGEAGQEYWAGIRIKVNGKMARETFKKCTSLRNQTYEYLNLEEKELFKLTYPVPAQELEYNKKLSQTKGHI